MKFVKFVRKLNNVLLCAFYFLVLLATPFVVAALARLALKYAELAPPATIFLLGFETFFFIAFEYRRTRKLPFETGKVFVASLFEGLGCAAAATAIFALLFPFIFGYSFAADCWTPIKTTLVFGGLYLLYAALFLALFGTMRFAPIRAADPLWTRERRRKAAKNSRWKIAAAALPIVVVISFDRGICNNSPFRGEGWLAPPMICERFARWGDDLYFGSLAFFFFVAFAATTKAALETASEDSKPSDESAANFPDDLSDGLPEKASENVGKIENLKNNPFFKFFKSLREK